MSDLSVITGGAGFIGTNMANRLLRQGRDVVLIDDLSREGVRSNLQWLRETHGDRVHLACGDVRDPDFVRRAVTGAARVFHFAAQVAVTTSVSDPRHDLGVNLMGTFNLLEELRRLEDPPVVLFTSTNKVYGDLRDIAIERRGDRYEPVDDRWRTNGVDESRSLDFCSPYGCSKGAADQYVLDYAKSFGLPSVVFRMSCIYGPHQQGNEDQGWVAHFVKQVLSGQPLTLYGDGRQVRDVLFVEDLTEAMLLATENIGLVAGQAFNMGGGPHHTVSLLELLGLIATVAGRAPEVTFGDWRIGDQRWYVSDTRRFESVTGWQRHTDVTAGVEHLVNWLQCDNLELSRGSS